MPRRFPVAILGGTFDRLHRGHRALLAKAFELADRVGIGVTTASYLRAFPKRGWSQIRSYRLRTTSLRSYLRRNFSGRTYWIAPLNDRFGRALDPAVNALIVSSATRAGGLAVNRLRRARRIAPAKIIEVPMTRGMDGFEVSSTRIRAGIIDRDGRRTVPLAISVSPASFQAAVNTRRLKLAFRRLTFVRTSKARGLPFREGYRVRISRARRGPRFSARVWRRSVGGPKSPSARGSGSDPTEAVVSAMRQILG